MISVSSLTIMLLPVLASTALQSVASASGDIASLITSILNLGAGGLFAVVFYNRWQYAERKREAAEKRLIDIALKLAKIDSLEDVFRSEEPA